MYIKRPETAEEFVEVFHDFMELLQTTILETGFELSIVEQIDLFQQFIDQWESNE